MNTSKNELKFKSGDKVLVRQIRSAIGRPKDQRLTLHTMGLGRIGNSTTQVLNKSLFGKINKVWHLIDVRPVQ